jgi:hypothetical protein
MCKIPLFPPSCLEGFTVLNHFHPSFLQEEIILPSTFIIYLKSALAVQAYFYINLPHSVQCTVSGYLWFQDMGIKGCHD